MKYNMNNSNMDLSKLSKADLIKLVTKLQNKPKKVINESKRMSKSIDKLKKINKSIDKK